MSTPVMATPGPMATVESPVPPTTSQPPGAGGTDISITQQVPAARPVNEHVPADPLGGDGGLSCVPSRVPGPRQRRGHSAVAQELSAGSDRVHGRLPGGATRRERSSPACCPCSPGAAVEGRAGSAVDIPWGALNNLGAERTTNDIGCVGQEIAHGLEQPEASGDHHVAEWGGEAGV